LGGKREGDAKDFSRLDGGLWPWRGS
jgi:hypothetical protein